VNPPLSDPQTLGPVASPTALSTRAPRATTEVTRSVFADPHGHRRIWTRLGAAAATAGALTYILGAGMLLGSTPATVTPPWALGAGPNASAPGGNGFGNSADGTRPLTADSIESPRQLGGNAGPLLTQQGGVDPATGLAGSPGTAAPGGQAPQTGLRSFGTQPSQAGLTSASANSRGLAAAAPGGSAPAARGPATPPPAVKPPPVAKPPVAPAPPVVSAPAPDVTPPPAPQPADTPPPAGPIEAILDPIVGLLGL